MTYKDLVAIADKANELYAITRLEEPDGEIKPWFNADAVAFIETWNIKEWNIFEWGSGLSTLWWAKRCQCIYTVEDYRDWANAVSKCFSDLDFRNIILATLQGEDYINFINTVSAVILKDKLDLVIIDGYDNDMRVQCCHQALKYTKSGGYIIFDDVEKKNNARSRYILSQGCELIKSFPRTPDPKHAKTTEIWKKF